MTGWFPFPPRRPDAGLRLFCLPYAGGGSAIFHGWADHLPGIDVAPARLPGRESRFREPAFDRATDLAEALAAAVRAELDRPYALFGHSMGGRLAFEVARALRRAGVPAPQRLIVSGSRAPHLPVTGSTGHLDDAAFLAAVRAMGGAPDEFFASAELTEMLLPALRADFSVVETYTYRPEAPLDVPVVSICGTADPQVPTEEAHAWAAETTAGFTLRTVAGGHFFLHERPDEVLAVIQEALRPVPLGPG